MKESEKVNKVTKNKLGDYISKANKAGIWSSYCISVGLLCILYGEGNFEITMGIINFILGFLHFLFREMYLWEIDEMTSDNSY
jgi:hypothetical protein